jgi:hypothetical protein
MKLKTLTTISLVAAALYAVFSALYIWMLIFPLNDGRVSATQIVLSLVGIALAASYIKDAIQQYQRVRTIRNNPSPLRRAEDRLDELERLKRRDMVTPEEYAAKRREILKDL